MHFTHLEKETEERKENLQDWSVWNVAMRLICLSQRMKKCLKPVRCLLINVIIAMQKKEIKAKTKKGPIR